MKKWICLCLILLWVPLVGAQADPEGHYNWYEIFVRSYQDSDGDGLGDLKGVEARLDYLEDMGYDGLWLMPIMPSPSYHKYDVTDYCAVDPQYGTLDDLRGLIEAAHARGISVIVDLPINHTSVQHPWFVEAVRALQTGEESPYVRYYCFSKQGGGRQVPVPGTDLYYEEQFSGGGMPDLNLDEPMVRAEIEQILAFWLREVGVDGFRLDAVTSYYASATAKNVEFLRWVNETCQALRPGAYLVGECWAGLSVIAQYYESGLDSFFLFPASQAEGFLASSLRGRDKHAEKFAAACQNALEALPSGVPAPFLCNHDTGRTLGAVRGRNNLPVAKFAEGLLQMMPGCVFTYYGEEIGMVGSGDDPNKRLAMYWADGDMTDQPPGVSKLEYVYPSVQAQQADPASLLAYCREATRARKRCPAIAQGIHEFVCAEGELCLMRRTLGEESVYIALNFSADTQALCPLQGEAAVLCDLETGEDKASITPEGLSLPPYAIVLFTQSAP